MALALPATAKPDATKPKAEAPKAQQRPEMKKPGASAPAPTQEQFEEAQRRYNRAMELFNEGSYDASLLEFRRAYELAPTYKILYNVALVNVQLNDYAQALEYFERYLADGGSEIEEQRRQDVQKEIDRMNTRVARVDIKANVAGAQVTVDDFAVGQTPLQRPVRVNAGRRRIAVAAKGKVPATRVVELAGGDSVTLDFDLQAPRGETRETTRIIERREKSFPWPAWIGTAVLATGAGVTGVLALRAHSDLEDEKNKYDASEAPAESNKRREDLRDKQRNFSIATDVLAGSAIILGGLAVYLTVTNSGSTEKVGSRSRPSVDLGVGFREVRIHGSF